MDLRYGPLREIIEVAILALAVFWVVQSAVQNFQVEGASMSPTLHNADLVLVNKLAYQRLNLGPFDTLVPGKDNGEFLFGGPERGDVVVFRSPFDAARDFVKRVVGIPGDVVEVRDGRILVNGQPLEETSYISAPPNYTQGPQVVPPEHYFVLGDNRNASQDSHVFGAIHEDLLVGKVVFRWFPLDAIGGGGSRDLVTASGTALP